MSGRKTHKLKTPKGTAKWAYNEVGATKPIVKATNWTCFSKCSPLANVWLPSSARSTEVTTATSSAVTPRRIVPLDSLGMCWRTTTQSGFAAVVVTVVVVTVGAFVGWVVVSVVVVGNFVGRSNVAPSGNFGKE